MSNTDLFLICVLIIVIAGLFSIVAHIIKKGGPYTPDIPSAEDMRLYAKSRNKTSQTKTDSPAVYDTTTSIDASSSISCGGGDGGGC